MIRIFAISLFILWSSISYSQTTKDSLSELQSLLDSIPDISLAELGIDTTAEIVPDTLHLDIPTSIASDTAYARTCLNQAIELIKTAKYDDAYTKADTAKHIYQMNIGYVSKEVADCLHQIGRSLNFKGEISSSVTFNLKSAKLLLKLFGENDLNLLHSLNSLALNYFNKGNFHVAKIIFSKVLNIRLTKLPICHPDIGSALYNLGNTCGNMENHNLAIKFFKYALKNRSCNASLDSIQIAKTYNNLGIVYKILNEIDTAIFCHAKALNIRLNLSGQFESTSLSYYNLGICYLELGKCKEAIKYFEKKLSILNNSMNINYDQISDTYNLMGYTCNHMSDHNTGLYYHENALLIRLRILGKNSNKVADSYLNLGVSYQYNGNLILAEKYFTKAKDIYIRNLGTNSMDYAMCINNLGYIEFEKMNFIKAIELHKEALKIRLFNYGEYNKFTALSYYNLGICYMKLNNFTESYYFLHKCLEIRNKVYYIKHQDIASIYKELGNLSFLQLDLERSNKFLHMSNEIYKCNGNVHECLINLTQIIENYNLLYHIDSSIYCIEKGRELITEFNQNKFSFEAKNQIISRYHDFFNAAINTFLKIFYIERNLEYNSAAYEYTELAKASLLQSQIKQTDALAFAGIPDSLLQKEYDLRIDINWREKQRQGLLEKGKTETDTTVLRISSIIFDLKREQEALFEILEKDYSEYYRLKYDTKTISLADTQQKLLQKGQTMLEYFVGDSSIFIFVVRPDTFDVVQVKKDFPLDSLVRQMQNGLYSYHGQSPDNRTDVLYKKSIIDYTYSGHELYNRIIAPVAHHLTKDLVIIPDGVLGYVPFEALLKSKPEKLNQFATYPYMINDHNISYNYSATLWNEMKNKKHKKEPSKSLVAFAPFYEGSFTVLDSTINLVFDTLPDGKDTTIFEEVVTRKTYAPLPSSGIEAGTVSKMYKGDYFVNNDATEQKFYDVAGDYRMVHLSTHGVADARQGDYSYLAFAEQKDSIENEFLYVRDIYNTQLNADLVFLSACETAQGELQRGEGIISLARAFAYAGAKSIITTLWQVDDAATKDISIDFYKNLKKGFPKYVALRQAKLRHIKSAKSAQKHPFFWAAMIGIGDMGVMKAYNY